MKPEILSIKSIKAVKGQIDALILETKFPDNETAQKYCADNFPGVPFTLIESNPITDNTFVLVSCKKRKKTR